MNLSRFEEFCGGTFWNTSLLLNNSWPEFTSCFMNTVLVWVPCGYVWLLLPYFLYDVTNEYSANNPCPPPLPVRRKHVPCKVYTRDTTISTDCKPLQVVESPRGTITAVCLVKMVLTCLLASLSLFHLALNVRDGQPAAVIMSSEIWTVTYMVVGFQLWYEQRHGRIAMFISFYFYMMNILIGIIPLYTGVITQDYLIHQENFSLVVANLCVNLICFVLSFIPDNPLENRKGYKQMDSNTSLEALTSYPLRLFFLWLLKLIATAVRKGITADDVFHLNARDKGSRLNPLFEQYWEEEVMKVRKINDARFSYTTISSKKNESTKNNSSENKTCVANCHGYTPDNRKVHENTSLLKRGRFNMFGTWASRTKVRAKTPSLFRVLHRMEWKNAMTIFIKKTISDLLLFSGPLTLGLLVDRLQLLNERTLWQAYIICLIPMMTTFLRSLLMCHSKTGSIILGLHTKTVLVSAMYRKVLSMSSSARKGYAVGEIVNMMSMDCHRLQELLSDAHFMMSGPVQIILAMVLLYVSIGPAMVAGICVLVLTIPLSSWIVGKQKVIQVALIKQKDKRIKLVNEALNGMQVLKLYAWEDDFKKKVEKIRSLEIKQLYKVAFLYALSEVTMGITPFLCSTVTFATYLLMDRSNVLDPKTAFMCLALFNLLRIPVISIKVLVVYLIQIIVAIKRVNKFLNTEDLDYANTTLKPDAEHAISIKDGTFTWNSTIQPTICNINANFACGKLTAIVGSVGSGKSSLISAILGEMPKLRGDVTIKGTVAYVSQQAWIQNATVRENILFGKEYIKQRYMQVIKACELESDLRILKAGDLTEIGEKGNNLSGGQKQRLSLARAVYSDSDIYLFDDPLSAVDACVGKAIFKNIIGNKGILVDKTRVLVTHGTHWLSQVDNILVLTKGIISEQGSYDELVTHNGSFAKFLQTYLTNNDSDEYSSDEDEENLTDPVTKMIAPNMADIFFNSSSTDMSERKCQKNKENIRIQTSAIDESYDHTTALNCGAGESGGKLTVDENLNTGKVTKDVLVTFWRAVGPCGMFIAFLFFSLHKGRYYTTAGGIVWGYFILIEWTKDPLLLNATMRLTPEGDSRMNYYLTIYGAVLGLILLLALAVYNYIYWNRMVRAAHTLHQQMIDRIFRAPMSFFDQTPTGRILNRISKDVDTVDTVVPIYLNDSASIMSFVFIIFITILIQTPFLAPVIAPICVIFCIVQKYYTCASRQLKRIESVTRSPIFTHLSESYTGASTIRAYGATERFVAELEEKVDKNQAYFFTNQMMYSWLQLSVDTLASLTVFFAPVILISQGGGASDIGLSLSVTLQLPLMLTYMVKQIMELETSIVAMERMKEYSQIEQEAALIKCDKQLSSSWPNKGDITFTEYQTRYGKGPALVLKGINCCINGGEKIGVIGRTGAGKSSLSLSLFRIIEAVSGTITIDGVNIADIGLHNLRSKLTVLPQDPFIFSGSLRMNIDPFEQYTDEQLWAALERSHLKKFVSAQTSSLNFVCEHDGSNLSVGQRQLICLARALLRRTKILILDEATATVDMETDAFIQKTIKEEFSDCTIIAIAHRLNTIMDYDRIIVMDDGVISEFDTPGNLINSKGIFYSMCKDAGLV